MKAESNTNQLDTMMNILGNVMRPIHDLFKMESVWVSEHKKRYRVGDTVFVPIDCPELFTVNCNIHTHKISKLMGTLNDSRHEITFEDLKTGELTTINL